MGELAYLLSGDPNEVVTWHRDSRRRGGRRTIAHLEATHVAAVKRFGSGVVVLQGAYNTTVAASAGTHDKDGCLDYYIPGVDWWAQQHFFREQGWAAWYRFPPLFGHHVHGISLGCTGPLGVFVPGQISDYYAHRSGLKGHAADTSWHPDDIDSTIFDFPAWQREQEDDMPYREWDQADRDALSADVVKALLAAPIDLGDEKRRSLAQVLKELWNTQKRRSGK